MEPFHCYTLQEAIDYQTTNKHPFIIANERKTKNKCGRFFTVLPSFHYFTKNKTTYPHAHEILVDHCNCSADTSGRLVFDFDIKQADINNQVLLVDFVEDWKELVPVDFNQQIEQTVRKTLDTFYTNIDSHKCVFIWSYCENDHKISKHLTVKHCYFVHWIEMARTFYRCFCKLWDETYKWIKSSQLIDMQIVRKRASLRMVGCSKINGNPLLLENTTYHWTDTLIRIYQTSEKKIEQHIDKHNVKQEAFFDGIPTPVKHTVKPIKPIAVHVVAGNYPITVYQHVFNQYKIIDPDTFSMGKCEGKYLSLLRIKPGICLLSHKTHENDNAFLVINTKNQCYQVYFGCYRFCGKQKIDYLFTLTGNHFVCMMNPFYERKLLLNKSMLSI